jgi:hypothetical protein
MHKPNRQIQVLADPEAVSRVAASEFLRPARASIEQADALRKVLEPAEGSDPIPAQLIRPTEGEAKWLVDQRAASRLSVSFPVSSGDAWSRLR